MVAKTEGEQYDVKHKPIYGTTSRGIRACVVILPSGRMCQRPLNRYEDVRGRKHWRHNPRPYYNH